MIDSVVEGRKLNPINSFMKYVGPALILCFILIVGIPFIVLTFGVDVYQAVFVDILVITIVLLGGFVWYVRDVTWAQYGYNINKDSTRPMFFSGSKEYTMYRRERTGRETRPLLPLIGRSIRQVRENQRNLNCSKFECEVDFMAGCYFIETRKIQRVLFIPINEEVQNVKAFCSEHPPEVFL